MRRPTRARSTRARAPRRRGARPVRRLTCPLRPSRATAQLAGSGRAGSSSVSWTSIPVAFLAGMVSFLAPCVLPLVPGYLSAVSAVDADRLGEPGNARRVVVGQRPVRPRLHGVLRAPRRRVRRSSAAGSSATSSCSSGSRASCSSCSGSRSWGSCPGPSASSAPACSRERGAAARASCSAARSPSAPRRASGRCSRRSSSSPARRTPRFEGAALLGVYSLGLAVPFVLAGALFTRAMSAFRWLRDHYRVDPDRRRRDHGRARAAALLRAVLRAARLPEPLPRVARARAGVLIRRAGAGSVERAGGDEPRARSRRPSRTTVDVDAAMRRARTAPRRRAAFSSWRSQPGRLPRSAWSQATATWTSPWRKSRSVGRRVAPLVLELLVRLEVRARADQLEALARGPSRAIIGVRGGC